MSVSIILPTYQREQELRDTLRALLDQVDDSVEIIVVDQTEQHEPETETFLAQVKDRVRLVKRSPPNLVDALNTGAAHARGDLLLLLDDDIIPSSQLVAAHRAAFTDPAIAIVAGRVIDSRGRVVESKRVGRVNLGGEVEASYSATKPAEAESAPGGNMSVRRSVFREVGGVQPGYLGTAVFNETDFCCLVRSRGWRAVFRPEAEIFHIRASHGGCANRQASLRPRYSVYHNHMLFSLRALPWYGIPVAIAARLNEAMRSSVKDRRPFILMALVGITHGFLTWLRTGARRYPPPRRTTESTEVAWT